MDQAQTGYHGFACHDVNNPLIYGFTRYSLGEHLIKIFGHFIVLQIVFK